MTFEPMRPLLDDFDSIIELVDECFTEDRDSGGMLARWPHAHSQWENRFIIKDGSKAVSHIGYVDQTILVDGAEIKVAGITGVATLPDYRRRGFMTKILNHCISVMIEEGFAFSDLGGDRQRYGHFGWEDAGREWRYSITPRSFGETSPEGFEVIEYKAEPSEIDGIIAIHEQEPLRMKRDRKLYEMLLSRAGRQTWLALDDEEIKAYAISISWEKHREIMEFGGSAEGMKAIFGYFMKSCEAESIGVRSPYFHKLNSELAEISTGWQLVCPRMLKILDLEKVMAGFSDQLGRRYREYGLVGRRTVSLGIAGTEQQVQVDFSDDGVSVGKLFDPSKVLNLPEIQMVRLIFGPGSPGTSMELAPDMRFLDALLPVDFYLWENGRV